MWAFWALTLLAAQVQSVSSKQVVIQPVANLYSKPSLDADVVSQAIYSTHVDLLERQQDWVRVRTPDQYTGWIESKALVAASAYPQPDRAARVESLFANLYVEPDITKHQPVLTVPFETRLEVIAEPEGENRRWVQVRLPTGGTAWVQRGDITRDERKQSIAETIELSKRFLGLPYLWGGVSTFGYDCSGLTQMLYRRRGYTLPRDADQQAAWDGVKPVVPTDLQPGDLLFFGSSPQKITHTGMYIGNGEFINATAYLKPVVQICRVGDDHWSKLLVAARRIK
jgi:cell wall-associated NlpC family hydrolase